MMMTEKRSNESRSRAEARQIIEDSVGTRQWALNQEIVTQLQKKLLTHPLQKHPILMLMGDGRIDLEIQKIAHLEFAHAFSQPFTDLLLSAMLDTVELREQQGPTGQMSARFLIGLNLLEELGFTLDPESTDDISTPHHSHYLELLKSIKALGISDEERDSYQPSSASLQIREMMKDARGNLLAELTCLTVSESLFPIFSGSWAESVQHSGGINIESGFHSIHVEDEDGNNIEDDHGGDAWHLLTQALSAERSQEADDLMNDWLNVITSFLDGIASHVSDCVTAQ